MAKHIVAIVGRPNVGKSTLFNRLIGDRKAITDNVSGVTRDRIYGDSHWNGRDFMVVDTGGFVKNTKDVFEKEIRTQVLIAIEEAEVIIFMTDTTTGITNLDEEVANLLRPIAKKVIVGVNKVDNNTRMLMANEFWSLGFENTIFLSSITGSGTGELLDLAVELLPPEVPVTEEEEEIAKLAIVGQPNVGKSSFINALMGESRNIVTDIAGTTRDSLHSQYSKYGMDFVLIDTAGIRKKNKVHEDLEFYSVMRAIRAIEEANVCMLIIDATLGIEKQDMQILSLVMKRKKGLVILVNKWDLIPDKETNTAKEYTEELKLKLAPFVDVPILYISATEKQRIFKALELAKMVFENRTRKIKTSKLNEVMQEAMEKVPPPRHRGKTIRIKYVTQLPTAYPSFAFFCNHPQHVGGAYKNYLENQLRQHWDFKGVPLTIYFRAK